MKISKFENLIWDSEIRIFCFNQTLCFLVSQCHFKTTMDKEDLQYRYGRTSLIIVFIICVLSLINNDSCLWLLFLIFSPMIFTLAYGVGVIIANIQYFFSNFNNNSKNVNKNHEMEFIEMEDKLSLQKEESNILKTIKKVPFNDTLSEISSLKTYEPRIKKCFWCNTTFEDGDGSSIDRNYCCDQCYFDYQCHDSED